MNLTKFILLFFRKFLFKNKLYIEIIINLYFIQKCKKKIIRFKIL